MKFNIYYGSGEDFSKQELINFFDTIEQSENFLFNYIKEHHPNSEYIRTTFITDTQRQYDYGNYTKFYTIIKSIEVVAAVIFKDNKIFATQRGYGEFKDGWEFPGGKIEIGESNEQALTRELKEELNVEIEVREQIQTVEYDYPAFHLTMHCYKAFLKDAEPELLEHEAACWVGKDEIDKLKWLPADKEVIKTVKGLLN